MHFSNRLRSIRALLVEIVCCLIAVGCGGSSTNNGGYTGPEDKSVQAKLAMFDKVQTGMTEQQVRDIMGRPLFDETVDPDEKSSLRWREGYYVFIIDFQDGRVVRKTSGGMSDMPTHGSGTKVNPDRVRKIKVGMTMAEVEAKLGRRSVKAGATIPEFRGEVFVWESHLGTINIGFIDEKVAIVGAWVDAPKPANATTAPAD